MGAIMTNKDYREEAELEAAENTENINNENAVADDENTVAPEDIPGEGEMGGGEIGILKKKIESLEKALSDKSDEVLRRAADLDNYRKRLTKESDERVKYANQTVIKDFLPVVDNIELTLQHTEDGSPLRQGIELTIKSFKDALFKHGIKEVESAVGTLFDPAVHEALMMDSNPDYDNNAVTLCIQKGYTLNDRVIRPAKVKVNKI